MHHHIISSFHYINPHYGLFSTTRSIPGPGMKSNPSGSAAAPHAI